MTSISCCALLRLLRYKVALLVMVASVSAASAQSPPSMEAAEDPIPPGARDAESSYRVLLLYSEARLTPSVVRTDQALRARLAARSPRPVVFYTEFLDLNSFHGPDLQGELVRLLTIKYRQRPIDLIVAQGQLTVPFALQHRGLFSTPPIVFVGVEPSTFANVPASAGVTGTWRHRGWGETFDLARRLHPGIRRAVVVVGASEGERLWADSARQQLATRQGAVEVSYLIGARADDVLKTVAALPADAVVLAGPFLRDGSGADLSTPAFVGRMLSVSRAPIYGLTEGAVGSGIVGGYVVSFEAHGKAAADIALQVLSGQHPSPTAEGTTLPMFDDRQLRRWKIDRRLLPMGSVVLFHEPSLWERYRLYITGAASVIAVQTALIGLLLVQRAQRRRAQQSLAERLRFETLLSNLSAALASCPAVEIDREIETALRRIVEDLGTDRATLWALDDKAGEGRVLHSWTRADMPPMDTLVHEGQLPAIFIALRQGQVLRLPSPSTLPNAATDRTALAQMKTLSAAVAPLIEGGVVVGALSVGTVLEEHHWPDELVPRLRLLADVFANALARQRADEAAHESARDIKNLAGRLLTAEEDERRRIGRELHDGVNQELAALSIALTALERTLPPDAPPDRRQEIARLQARTVELAEAMRQLSHELHPGILQYAGLSATLQSHCREFDHGHDIAVTYRPGEALGEVPSDVALCLYRVTQEALRNAAMHAKASHASVNLTREGTDLVLTISDDGTGFDLAEARGRGLGLISLEERVRLVGGRLTIDTAPQRGTTMRVAVPTA
jgi:signal transduction histidine kinase